MRKIEIIDKWIEEGSKILVPGCGKGEIIKSLGHSKKTKGLGIDIDEAKVYEAITAGLSILQGDINNDLSDYPDKAFDYVIAHDIVQIMTRPDEVIRQMLRIGNKVIISFPNFAYAKIRFTILFSGRMPKTKLLPYEWYDTPNIHLFTIKDFMDFCRKEKINIEKQFFTGIAKKIIPQAAVPNFLAEFSYFLISK